MSKIVVVEKIITNTGESWGVGNIVEFKKVIPFNAIIKITSGYSSNSTTFTDICVLDSENIIVKTFNGFIKLQRINPLQWKVLREDDALREINLVRIR